MDEIIVACHAALSKNLKITVEDIRDTEFDLSIKGGDRFTVKLDEASVTKEEEGDGIKLQPDGKHTREKLHPKYVVKDHSDILDVCLAAMAADAEIQTAVTDLTTDGDGRDCEAIFHVPEYGYLILKVR
jgi:soluble P-type ATPase